MTLFPDIASEKKPPVCSSDGRSTMDLNFVAFFRRATDSCCLARDIDTVHHFCQPALSFITSVSPIDICVHYVQPQI